MKPVSWKVCPSLETLHGQINKLFPSRPRTSDGSIGDSSHASRSSDHNPHLLLRGQHWVSARDWTHDSSTLDCGQLSQSLLLSRDPRVKYVIWDRRIMAGPAGPAPWSWRPYRGANPHDRHLHLSVVATELSLDPSPWSLPTLEPHPEVLRLGDRGARVLQLQQVLNRWYPKLSPLVEDGAFGPRTEERVKYFQSRSDLEPDGIVGPLTRRMLGIK